jgi:hypothetical protein
MALTPQRPIALRFVFGKGNVKRRKESDDTSRAVIEQVTLAYAEANWESSKNALAHAIERDVRSELVHVAGQFRRNVIGAPSNQRGLVGKLTTVAKGQGQPSENLGSLPRWAPRGARYLEDKKVFAGHQRWFDNSGWEPDGGTLKEFFAGDIVDSPGGGDLNVGSGGILEDIFGGISATVRRNNRGWGRNAGTMKIGTDGHVTLQLASVYVRALGTVTDAMLRISDTPNSLMLNQIGRTDPMVALHLRGGRGRYRPTLEPYLRFFLRRAIPHAITQRIAKGTAAGRLFRKS